MRSKSAALRVHGFPAAFGPPVFRVALRFSLLVCLMVCGIGEALADRPAMVVPAAPDTVVQRLPSGYGSLAPRDTAAPMNATRLVGEATTLLAAAARTGDSRLAARADGLLARIPAADQTSDVLRVRAFSAQHRHDFDAALQLLDRLVQREPRDADARMSRAQIHLVQGKLDLARSDCAALIIGIDSNDGMLCVASIALRRSDLQSAATTLDRWLSQADPKDPRRGYATLMRAEISGRGNAPDADQWFHAALSEDPNDVRSLAAYARWLRAAHRDREVEPLLASTDVDGLQLQRALAAQASGAANAHELALAQQRRYDTAHAVGSQPEMRDEAEFLLTLKKDPIAAMTLAERNFSAQRDFEDVDILVRSARAANRPDALDSVTKWAREQAVAIPPAYASIR